MNIGDFFSWAGRTTVGVGGALNNGGSTQDWLNFSGGALGDLGAQLGAGQNPNYPIYIPIGNQNIQTSNSTLMYIGLALLAVFVLKR